MVMGGALARLFGREHGVETKRSRVGRLIAMHHAGRPVWTPRDMASLAREGFQRNPVAYRAVRMVAEAAASLPILLYEGEREVEAHPLLDLLARPNGRQSGTEMLEAAYGHLMIAGNAYLEAAMLDGEVRELHGLRPDRMRVVAGADGWAEAYDYSVGAETVRFVQEAEPVRPILHLTLFHPLDDHYGMSPLEAAAASLDIHNASAAWNKALLDNAARPSGALVYEGRDGAVLSEEQFGRLKDELETSFQGAANAGRPLLLEGGLDWKAMSLSPKDMDFLEARNGAAREIALAFGVPPMLLGIPGDNTYANYREANLSFWRQTALPMARKTAQAMTAWLGPAYGESFRFEIDVDGCEALASEREALWARVGGAQFLTVDEKRAAVGYGPMDAG